MIPVLRILFFQYACKYVAAIIIYLDVFNLRHVTLKLFYMDLLFFFFR